MIVPPGMARGYWWDVVATANVPEMAGVKVMDFAPSRSVEISPRTHNGGLRPREPTARVCAMSPPHVDR